jgi:hypothetical protein
VVERYILPLFAIDAILAVHEYGLYADRTYNERKITALEQARQGVCITIADDAPLRKFDYMLHVEELNGAVLKFYITKTGLPRAMVLDGQFCRSSTGQ